MVNVKYLFIYLFIQKCGVTVNPN